jgi:hypothetical protein
MSADKIVETRPEAETAGVKWMKPWSELMGFSNVLKHQDFKCQSILDLLYKGFAMSYNGADSISCNDLVDISTKILTIVL